jgi:GDSL-like Lipase/Acylhydrolase family
MLAAVLCVLAAEGVVRVLGKSPQISFSNHKLYRLSPNPNLGYELAPAMADVNGNVTNPLGCRDYDRAAEKPPGTFRIAVLGDSVTYGLNVKLFEAFPKILEMLLNNYQAHDAVRFEVFNFGVSGYNIVQTTESYAAKALSVDPDLVVVAYHLNDPEPLRVQMGSPENMIETGDTPSEFSRFFLMHSRIVQLLKYQYGFGEKKTPARNGLPAPEPRPVPNRDPNKWAALPPVPRYLHEIADDNWPVVQDSLAKLRRAAAANHDPVLVAVLPWILPGEKEYPYRELNENIIAEVKSQGLEALDLLSGFAAAFAEWPGIDLRSASHDLSHPNPLGHRLLAVTLAEGLIRQGLLPLKEQDFLPELFSLEAARLEPKPEWYAAQDMVHAERAFWLIRKQEFNGATAALEETMRLNPRNPLIGEGCRRILQPGVSEELRRRAANLLKAWRRMNRS